MTRKQTRPPRFGRRLLGRLLPLHVREGALDDFDEKYEYLAAESGRVAAFRWYWFQIFALLPSFIIESGYGGLSMLRNYLLLTLRTMRKEKLVSFINMFSLSVGFAACVLALLYIRFELSYNRFHEHFDRIHRVDSEVFMRTNFKEFNTVPVTVGPAMAAELPEVESAVRLFQAGMFIGAGDKRFDERDIVFADPSFFEVFTFPFLAGDPRMALGSPNNVVLREETARRYFGAENPVGKTLTLMPEEEEGRAKLDFRVAGVVHIPRNSHIEFDFLVPVTNAYFGPRLLVPDQDRIGSGNTFVLMDRGGSRAGLEAKLADFRKNHYPAGLAEKRTIKLTPFAEIHSGYGAVGNMKLFGSFALVILAIAAFNFVNLSLARSLKRNREVGIRKVIGAKRGQLFRQFVGESVTFSVFALGIGFVLAFVFVPVANRALGAGLPAGVLLDPGLIAAAVLLALVTGILSGSYPALYLSRCNPVSVLKGGLAVSKRSAFPLRNVLLSLQFAASSLFIVASLVFYGQLRFLMTADLGFTPDNVVTVKLFSDFTRHMLTDMRSALMQSPDIAQAAYATSLPFCESDINIFPKPVQEDDSFAALVRGEYLNAIYCDASLPALLGLTVTAGGGFTQDKENGPAAQFLITESSRRSFDEDIEVNPGMSVPYYTAGNTMRTAEIAGTLPDFHYTSMRFRIHPLVLTAADPPAGRHYRFFAVKVRGDMQDAVEYIKETMASFAPDDPFEYSFYDERIAGFYADEERYLGIGLSMAAVTILIAAMGLSGLASFTLQQRMKEVSVRKVFGADIRRIVFLLSRRYIVWVTAANVVALPLAFLWMNGMLQSFAYRIGLSWGYFAVGYAATLCITLAAIGFKVLKLARSNPANTLRYE